MNSEAQSSTTPRPRSSSMTDKYHCCSGCKSDLKWYPHVPVRSERSAFSVVRKLIAIHNDKVTFPLLVVIHAVILPGLNEYAYTYMFWHFKSTTFHTVSEQNPFFEISWLCLPTVVKMMSICFVAYKTNTVKLKKKSSLQCFYTGMCIICFLVTVFWWENL